MRIIEDFIPIGRNNRPGYPLTPQYITIHNTGNKQAGALAHASYIKSDSAADAPVSWHFTVDDQVIVQHLPLNENGWHAGDGLNGPGNRTSIGIEICEYIGIDQERAEANAAELVADLLQRFNLGIDRVVQHNKWSGKNCPAVIRARLNGWSDFLATVQSHFDMPIVHASRATVNQAKEWAKSRGATETFINIAEVFWRLAPATGVDPAAAYAQAAKETAFGRFGGVINETYYNTCGLKNAQGGDNYDPNAHHRFASWDEGIQAHLDHLALYAGAPGYPKPGSPDPRHFTWLAGRAPTLESLGGKWAPANDYGQSIVTQYLKPMMAMVVNEKPAAELLAKITQLEVDKAQLQKEKDDLAKEMAQLTDKLAKVREILG